MDYVWTPWRYAYITAPRESDGARNPCPFCRALRPGADDREFLIVRRGEWNCVMLNRYPYTSGHMMVIPHAHVARLADLGEEASAEMMRLVRSTERVLDELYRPEGINVGMNLGRAAGAGVAGHIHMHALPRWAGDSSFVTVIGETRVLPEDLAVTWERARAAFAAASE